MLSSTYVVTKVLAKKTGTYTANEQLIGTTVEAERRIDNVGRPTQTWTVRVDVPIGNPWPNIGDEIQIDAVILIPMEPPPEEDPDFDPTVEADKRADRAFHEAMEGGAGDEG